MIAREQEMATQSHPVRIKAALTLVAGEIPSIHHVFLLLLEIAKVTASRRTTHNELADTIWRKLIATFIDNSRLISRNNLTRRTWADVRSRRANEDVKHLRSTDAIDDLETGGRKPSIKHALRQCFTRRDALPQARDIMTGQDS